MTNLKQTMFRAAIFAVASAIGALCVHAIVAPGLAGADPTNKAFTNNAARLYMTPHQREQARSADDMGYVFQCNAADVGKDVACNAAGEIKFVPVPAAATAVLVNVPCDAAGAAAYTSTATDRAVWVSNADTEDDVCIRYGTAGEPDETDDQTCNLKLGPYAGAGSRKTVALPAGFQADFECACAPTVDGDGDCDLVVSVVRD